MKSPKLSKNVEFKKGKKYYQRWTVLDINADVVEIIKKTAAENHTSVGRALETLIEANKKDDDKLKIGLDYWQVISHYTDYFKDFATRMLEAGHEIHIITAVGKDRAANVLWHIEQTRVPYTKKHKVIFKDPKESPQLKLDLCLKLGIDVFYDDRDDVCRTLNKNNIIAMRVTRKDNSTYDLEAEQSDKPLNIKPRKKKKV